MHQYSSKLSWHEKLVCTITSVLLHLQFGCIVSSDFGARVYYPTLSSTLFVLTTQLLLHRVTLQPRALILRNYATSLAYNMVLSYFVSNIALVFIYQSMIGVLFKVVLQLRSLFKSMGFSLYCAFNGGMVCIFAYVLVISLLLWVLRSCSRCKPCGASFKTRDTRPYEERKGYILSDRI